MQREEFEVSRAAAPWAEESIPEGARAGQQAPWLSATLTQPETVLRKMLKSGHFQDSRRRNLIDVLRDEASYSAIAFLRRFP